MKTGGDWQRYHEISVTSKVVPSEIDIQRDLIFNAISNGNHSHGSCSGQLMAGLILLYLLEP
jgi:hypothetical protein